MAIIPASEYTGKINAGTAAYPQGSAKNVSAPSAGDGTPVLASWVNDLWGFFQSVLSEGAVTPNGAPDSVTNAQYKTALKNIMQNMIVQEFGDFGNVRGLWSGRVNGDGSRVNGPATWTYSRVSNANYRVYHNLGHNLYNVVAFPFDGNTDIFLVQHEANYFQIAQQVHNSSEKVNVPFHFIVCSLI